jgi:hypothetical protein
MCGLPVKTGLPRICLGLLLLHAAFREWVSLLHKVEALPSPALLGISTSRRPVPQCYNLINCLTCIRLM